MNSIVWARRLAIIEATSYLVLMAGVVAKYGFDEPTGVSAMGPVHGVLVLFYAAALWRARPALGWDQQRLVTAIVLGAIPLGGFWVERNWLGGGSGAAEERVGPAEQGIGGGQDLA